MYLLLILGLTAMVAYTNNTQEYSVTHTHTHTHLSFYIYIYILQLVVMSPHPYTNLRKDLKSPVYMLKNPSYTYHHSPTKN